MAVERRVAVRRVGAGDHSLESGVSGRRPRTGGRPEPWRPSRAASAATAAAKASYADASPPVEAPSHSPPSPGGGHAITQEGAEIGKPVRSKTPGRARPRGSASSSFPSRFSARSTAQVTVPAGCRCRTPRACPGRGPRCCERPARRDRPAGLHRAAGEMACHPAAVPADYRRRVPPASARSCAVSERWSHGGFVVRRQAVHRRRSRPGQAIKSAARSSFARPTHSSIAHLRARPAGGKVQHGLPRAARMDPPCGGGGSSGARSATMRGCCRGVQCCHRSRRAKCRRDPGVPDSGEHLGCGPGRLRRRVAVDSTGRSTTPGPAATAPPPHPVPLRDANGNFGSV